MTQSTIARYGYVARFTGFEFRSPAARKLIDKHQFIELSEARERPVDESPSQEPFDAAADFLYVGTAVECGNTEEAFSMRPEAGARSYDH